MEHYYKNLKELAIKLSSQPMNKMMITQLLVSVSIFSSLLFSLSSLYSSSPLIMYFGNLNSFSSKYTSNFQMILGAGMNKNFVFLICNGLLVFLAKTSGSVLSSPSGNSAGSNDMLQNKTTCDDGFQIVTETKPAEPEVAVGIGEIISSEVPVLEKDIITFEEICECKEEEDEHIEIKEVTECSSTEITGNEVSVSVAENITHDQEEAAAAENDENVPVKFWLSDGDQLKEEEEEVELELHGEEEEEEEKFVDDEMEQLSTEELNQKFEGFIRKMKEEFRINNEATQRQQLVMVN